MNIQACRTGLSALFHHAIGLGFLAVVGLLVLLNLPGEPAPVAGVRDPLHALSCHICQGRAVGTAPELASASVENLE